MWQKRDPALSTLHAARGDPRDAEEGKQQKAKTSSKEAKKAKEVNHHEPIIHVEVAFIT